MLKLAIILCTVLVGSIVSNVVIPDVNKLLASYQETYESQRTMISEDAALFIDRHSHKFNIIKVKFFNDVHRMTSQAGNVDISDCVSDVTEFNGIIANEIQSIENCVETKKKEFLSTLQDNRETLKKDAYQLYNVGYSAPELKEGEESERKQKCMRMVKTAKKAAVSYAMSFEKILNEKCVPESLDRIETESQSRIRTLEQYIHQKQRPRGS